MKDKFTESINKILYNIKYIIEHEALLSDKKARICNHIYSFSEYCPMHSLFGKEISKYLFYSNSRIHPRGDLTIEGLEIYKEFLKLLKLHTATFNDKDFKLKNLFKLKYTIDTLELDIYMKHKKYFDK